LKSGIKNQSMDLSTNNTFEKVNIIKKVKNPNKSIHSNSSNNDHKKSLFNKQYSSEDNHILLLDNSNSSEASYELEIEDVIFINNYYNFNNLLNLKANIDESSENISLDLDAEDTENSVINDFFSKFNIMKEILKRNSRKINLRKLLLKKKKHITKK